MVLGLGKRWDESHLPIMLLRTLLYTYLDMYILHADYRRTLISPFYILSEVVYTICFSCCAYYLLFSTFFPPEVIFRSRVIGACPVTTDFIVAGYVMRKCENNNNLIRFIAIKVK